MRQGRAGMPVPPYFLIYYYYCTLRGYHRTSHPHRPSSSPDQTSPSGPSYRSFFCFHGHSPYIQSRNVLILYHSLSSTHKGPNNWRHDILGIRENRLRASKRLQILREVWGRCAKSRMKAETRRELKCELRVYALDNGHSRQNRISISDSDHLLHKEGDRRFVNGTSRRARRARLRCSRGI